jgi:hypothetical protein
MVEIGGAAGAGALFRRSPRAALAWPVVYSAAEPPLRGRPLDAFRAPLPAALVD